MPDHTDQMASAAAATRGSGGIIGGVIWQTDKPTQTAARNYPLPIYAPAPLFTVSILSKISTTLSTNALNRFYEPIRFRSRGTS